MWRGHPNCSLWVIGRTKVQHASRNSKAADITTEYTVFKCRVLFFSSMLSRLLSCFRLIIADSLLNLAVSRAESSFPPAMAAAGLRRGPLWRGNNSHRASRQCTCLPPHRREDGRWAAGGWAVQPESAAELGGVGVGDGSRVNTTSRG